MKQGVSAEVSREKIVFMSVLLYNMRFLFYQKAVEAASS